jgi:hypothetical protein
VSCVLRVSGLKRAHLLTTVRSLDVFHLTPSTTYRNTHGTHKICGQWFDYTAHRDEDGGVVGSSWEGNLTQLDVATRVLVLKRKTNGGTES